MVDLRDIIIQKIVSKGPISFHEYMEMALYHPDLGYYTSSPEKIGTKGDFFTSSNISSRFGAMIGRQLEEMWSLLGKKEFKIVEFGAGTGALCKDILTYLSRNAEFYENLTYCIIEKSPAMRNIEMAYLGEKVSWYNSITEIENLSGCIISNELIDNLAVHRVVMQEDLMEVYVEYKDNFEEVLLPASSEIKNYFKELDVSLEPGYQTEVNLEAINWLKDISNSLIRGFIITIDYGFLSDELYHNRRREGTLLCYNKHNINADYYENIGDQDITSHINFSALIHWGEKFGLQTCGLTNQADFLLALGFKNFNLMNENSIVDPVKAAMEESFITRTLLINMGHKFKVLIQKKNMSEVELTGLKNLQKPEM